MVFRKSIEISMFFVFTLSICISSIELINKIKSNNHVYISQRDMDLRTLNKIISNTVAEGVIVYDLNRNQVLGGKNIDKTYSLASITKIITANLAYQKNKNLLDDIRDMLKTSSNESADKIALSFANDTKSQAGYMNSKTSDYGLFFRNASGLDIKIPDTEYLLAGGEGKPQSVINFIKDYYLMYPEIFDDTLDKENNTNTIIDQLKFVSISKTGFTNLSGGNLFVSVQIGLGREIFILVLNSTEKNRFVDVQNIANFLLQSSI